MIIVLLGPPGCGKGTQAKLLADKLNIQHLSMGDMLRTAVKDRTEVGEIAQQYLNEGKLVPDEVINRIAKEQAEITKEFIMDGYPRTLVQATAFDKAVEGFKMEVGQVIYINLSLEEVLKRLSGRRSCSQCGKVYHLVFSPPKMHSFCDECGADLSLRADDKEDTVRERFQIYEESTLPLKKYYADRGKLLEVDGGKKIKEVFEEIISRLGIT